MANSFKGGLDLKFVANPEFESLENSAPEEHPSISARNALRLLMMGWPSESWMELLSWPFLKAIFVHRDPILLKELRLAFQQGFEILFSQLQGQKLNQEQSEQVQLYISNCLSLLPYSDLTPYESIKIPQNINGEWELVEYHITPIELTPTSGFSSLFVQDQDRVFAYGLEPIRHLGARSHLIFMGTTYPAGQGFLQQVKTDFKGFETVGKSLYLTGIEKIKAWLLCQKDKVYVCGVSLGGSLSLLLAIDQGKYLKRVDALNPAGLHDSLHKSQYDKWDELELKPQVVVQQQGNDPVSLLGVWKKGWQILQVTPPEDKKGPNALFDHFLNYAGFAQSEFSYVDAERENAERGVRNFWLYSVARSFVYYSAMVPFNYVIRPALYFVAQHWLSFTLAFISLIAIGVLIITGVVPLFGTLAAVALSSLAGTAYMVHRFFSDSIEDVEGRKNAKLHDPSLPRNPTMDIYNSDNKITVELTYQEINTYYKVMRCLVKQKNFLPESEKKSHAVNGLSKKELLIESQKPENKEVVVAIETTKAKAVHIKHVLTLVNQLGIENEHDLKKALQQDYSQYSIGKHH